MRELNCKQGSSAWHNARIGVVTGTRIGRVMGKDTTQENLMVELLTNMMGSKTDEDGFTNDAMERGILMEPIALACASKTLGFKYETLGMMYSSEIEGFATSPDAVVRNEEGVVIGGIEIKCPNTKSHLEYIVKGKIPAKYRYQIYAQFLVCPTVEWWHFMSYDDRCGNSDKSQEFYQVVWKKDILKELNEMETKLRAFIIKLNAKFNVLTDF